MLSGDNSSRAHERARLSRYTLAETNTHAHTHMRPRTHETFRSCSADEFCCSEAANPHAGFFFFLFFLLLPVRRPFFLSFFFFCVTFCLSVYVCQPASFTHTCKHQEFESGSVKKKKMCERTYASCLLTHLHKMGQQVVHCVCDDLILSR